MKQFILMVCLLGIHCISPAQKVDVTRGNTQKLKKITNVLGSFTIKGKPFLLVGESTRLIVDESAVFFSVEEDMSLGEAIRQENVNVIDGFMALEKCIYIENIIVNDGKTFLFYTKRNGKKAKVFCAELDEDCMINQENAVEVMPLELGSIDKYTNFTVRQSPDGSRILLAAMMKQTQKSSEFIFKVYDKGMKSLVWEKKFNAPATYEGLFKGGDAFNTGKDPNSITDNYFLVNNKGRVFFLANRTNVAETKADYSVISFDTKGENKSEVEVEEPGNWVGSTFFRLDRNGNANFIFFYSATASKLVIQVGSVNPVNTNTMRAVSYDGKTMDILCDHTFTNEEQALFYPAKNRKPKSEYKISDFTFGGIRTLHSGEIIIYMVKGTSTVGSERPASNTGNGYVCVMVLDSSYTVRYTHSFIRISFVRGLRGGWQYCDGYVLEGKFRLMYLNEKEEVQYINFSNLQVPASTPVSAKFSNAEGYPVFNSGMVYKGIFLPVVKDTEICVTLVK